MDAALTVISNVFLKAVTQENPLRKAKLKLANLLKRLKKANHLFFKPLFYVILTGNQQINHNTIVLIFYR